MSLKTFLHNRLGGTLSPEEESTPEQAGIQPAEISDSVTEDFKIKDLPVLPKDGVIKALVRAYYDEAKGFVLEDKRDDLCLLVKEVKQYSVFWSCNNDSLRVNVRLLTS